MNENEIFVSYAWKGASERLVDQLCETFAAKGYTLTRDKSAMTYKDSIKTFMDRIGRGKFILAVVNDKYMKSEYCMYEAYRMFQSPAFRERVFPIVLPDADIFSFSGQVAYLKHWQQAYQELETKYREIAHASPTMVAPLTERLRDIEATTRFINDFMAAVGDMNVLTSEIHLESNFAQLIEAIEARMQTLEEKESNIMSDEKVRKPTRVNTGGGAFIGGHVNTGGGDFVGRDKNVTASGPGSIAVGGNVQGSTFVTGSHNVIGSQVAQSFAPLYTAIENHPSLPAQDKADVKTDAQEIEEELKKGDQADETFLERRLRSIKRTAPDILEVILATLANPAAGFGVIAAKVVAKMKASAG